MRALPKAGNKIAMSNEIMLMTTSSSMSVNPLSVCRLSILLPSDTGCWLSQFKTGTDIRRLLLLPGAIEIRVDDALFYFGLFVFSTKY
jgi:hypothetical protein